jgi:hypothetical protein
MSTQVSSQQTSRHYHDAQFLVAAVIMAVVVSAFALHAVLYGPAMRERADRVRAEQVDRENRALCGKLGLASGGAQFAACAEVLSEVRRLEANWLANIL